MKRVIGSIGLAMLVGLSAFAVENAVNLTVQELRVGQSAIKVSGDSSQMLEKLYSGTYSVGTNAPNNTLIYSNLTLNGSASVAKTLVATGTVTCASNLLVTGSTESHITGPLGVSGATILGSTLVVTGAVTHTSTLLQTGAATFTVMPRFNQALAAPAAVTVTITNAPTSCGTVAKWVKFIAPDGSTNVFAAYAIP